MHTEVESAQRKSKIRSFFASQVRAMAELDPIEHVIIDVRQAGGARTAPSQCPSSLVPWTNRQTQRTYEVSRHMCPWKASRWRWCSRLSTVRGCLQA